MPRAFVLSAQPEWRLKNLANDGAPVPSQDSSLLLVVESLFLLSLNA